MHSFVSCHLHCVFATHKRERWLTPDIQPRLWSYLGGIARENKMTAVAVGGVEDHVHMLIALPATLSIAKALRAYIAKQAEHHRRVTFREEVETFLRKHNMAWVERDLEY